MARLTAEQQKLVEDNIALVHYIARRYHGGYRHTELWEDIIGEGYCGLCRASQTYDPALGAFSTYAAMWIRRQTSRYILAHRNGPIRPSYRVASGEYGAFCPMRYEYLDTRMVGIEGHEVLGTTTDDDTVLYVEDWIERACGTSIDVDRAKTVMAMRGDGCTDTEIAAALGVTRQRVHRVRSKLRPRIIQAMQDGGVC